MKFTKFEAAGNTYVIVDEDGFKLTPEDAIRCCHPIYGLGSDGIITWRTCTESPHPNIQVDIYNPDGSLAEKSGNGLRILATFLYETIFPQAHSLELCTAGGAVYATLMPKKHSLQSKSKILLEMGMVVPQFQPKSAPNSPVPPHPITLETELGPICGFPVSIGNPHFVIFEVAISAAHAQKFGRVVENHPIFPNRTNVQFVKVEDNDNVSAEIWERGAGYTLSSGSSSCAIAAVAHQLGFCGPKITVSTPGGKLEVQITKDQVAWLTGPVNKTVEGVYYL